MKCLAVASEVFPLVKTGGLADVTGALPAALAPHGVECRTLVPGYPAVMAKIGQGVPIHEMDNLFGGPARLLDSTTDGLRAFVLDAPHLYARTGGPYGWSDDAYRFAALARVGAEIGFGLLPDFVPDIVHAHDWQGGLVAAYLAFDGRRPPASVFTIHNLAFQGQFPASLLGALGLPSAAYTIEGVEYYGEIGFLKTGIRLSDRVTTVSPSYAAEICTPALGMGLDGLLRSRGGRLRGILNGIDTDVWNPATDPLIARTFDDTTIAARAANKAALQARLGLALSPATPLFGVVSRLSWQKGIDLVLGCVASLVESGAQLAILGAGDADGEDAVRHASDVHPGQIGCLIGYNETLAHLIQAGADALLVPSRFEPCGLTQLCALRYGAIPVVARTGGLADTVIDANPMALAAGVATGIQFPPDGIDMLDAAIRRTIGLYRDRENWARLQRNAMRSDVSWRDPGRCYASLYTEACARQRAL